MTPTHQNASYLQPNCAAHSCGLACFFSAADPSFEVMVVMQMSPKTCRMIRVARRLPAMYILGDGLIHSCFALNCSIMLNSSENRLIFDVVQP